MSNFLINVKVFIIILLLGSFKTSNSVSETQNEVPVITHITDPAIPGKLSVFVGSGWDIENPQFKAYKLSDSSIGKPGTPVKFNSKKAGEVKIIKNDKETLIGQMPEGDFTVYAIAARSKKGWGEPFIVNRAKIQWLSQEQVSEGDTLRIFGRNLVNLDQYPTNSGEDKVEGYGGYLQKISSSVMIGTSTGDFISCKVVKNSAYDVHFVLPDKLSVGTCDVYAHNGLGGVYGWSESAKLSIVEREIWPTKVFNVKDFGAKGMPKSYTEWFDDTESIQNALDAAKSNKGGVVYFPAGNYYVSSTLVIPKYTTLKGESKERAWIWFPDGIDHGTNKDFDTPKNIKVGLRGISDFTIEGLSIHSVFTKVLIAAPLSKDDIQIYTQLDNIRAKNVTIRNCYLAQEPTYRYHHRKSDEFLKNSTMLDESWGLMATVAIRGDNISVTDNWVRGGSMGIAYLACRNSIVARNEIYIGRGANAFACREGGYPEQPQQQKIIFEDNLMLPASATHHSGYWCHGTSSNFYIARNKLQLTWGCDSEGLLWHGAGPQQIYALSSANINSVSIKDKIDKIGVNWECVVVKGKGLGQRRMISQIDGEKVTLDNPWQIIPDENSMIAVLYWPCHRGHIIVDNSLSDTGAGIFSWGDSYDWIVDGNQCKRGGGVQFDVCSFENRPWSGNFFVTVINNNLDQGRFMGKYFLQNWTIGYTGTGYVRDNLRGTIGDLGHAYRGNRQTNDAVISFWDRVHGKKLDNYDGPKVDVGMVVEDNWFENSKFGISVGDGVSGVVKSNNFKNVDTPIRVKEHSHIINIKE